MNEEVDTPTVAEAVQSTPMVSLNDEFAPKTDNKMSVYQLVGSFIGRKKSKADESEEDGVAQFAKELEESRKERDRFKAALLNSEAEKKELITEMNCVARLKSAEIEKLESIIEYEAKLKRTEIESLKKESDVLSEKLKASRDEIDRYKKMEVELKSAMTRMESEIKLKSEEIDNLKRKSEADAASSKLESDRLNAKLEANRVEFDRYKRDLDAKKSEMEIEINSKAKEIECRQKLEDVSKARISQLEEEVKAANCKVEENLKVSGDVQRILEKVETNSGNVTRGFEKVEKNLRSILDRPTEMTIRARFTDISKLTEHPVFSHPTELAGIIWRIQLYKNYGHLGIYLGGKKLDTDKCSCVVFANFQLLSQKDDTIVKGGKFAYPHVYCASLPYDARGFRKFIAFEDLLKGDAVMDDSIIVAVVVQAFPSNI